MMSISGGKQYDKFRTRLMRCAAFFSLGVCLVVSWGCERPRFEGAQANEEMVAALRKKLTSASTEGGADGGAAATETGWATLTGTFRYADGATIPARQPLKIDKETNVCKPGGVEVLSQALVIDEASRGIANVVVYLRKASREHESVTAAPEQVLFDQKTCEFLSHVMAIRVGQTLDIKNSDPVVHNTNYNRPGMRGQSFNSIIPIGQMVPFQPTKEEGQPVDVSCSIHPWMKAYILPRENGYFAVTKPDGSFTIENLPAGEDLEFQVWHESGAGAAGALVAEAPDVKWSRSGRFKIKLQEDEAKTLPVTVPAASFK